MEFTKFIGDKNDIIVKNNEVKVPATLRNIPHGTIIHFTRKELGIPPTVKAAVSRENSKKKEFHIKTDYDGDGYWIARE